VATSTPALYLKDHFTDMISTIDSSSGPWTYIEVVNTHGVKILESRDSSSWCPGEAVHPAAVQELHPPSRSSPPFHAQQADRSPGPVFRNDPERVSYGGALR
jgi:hypothetical protein